jgi:hypothetical protein
MPDTLPAEVGRRIILTGYSGTTIPYPGIITDVTGPLVHVRLDGHRSYLEISADSPKLRYLDEVVPVPVLPMGRFYPTSDDLGFEYDGVPIGEFEDGDVIALTTDPAKAAAAINRFDREMAGEAYYDPEFAVTARDVELRWAYFEWQPEDAECQWLVHWATAADDKAIQLHYLYR